MKKFNNFLQVLNNKRFSGKSVNRFLKTKSVDY
jgi:hypothetical protein